MKKLGILISHYKEPLEMLKKMLDSINVQNVDFSNIKVYIFNDGKKVVFEKNDFDGYNYEIEYVVKKRSGISKMRNMLLRESKEEYIWFLDSDDYLLDNTLHEVLGVLKKNDNLELLLIGALRENKKNKTNVFFPDYLSFSIMGCSIFKRQFLIENKIYADENEYLGGDIALENLPKYYTTKRKRLKIPILFYAYNSKSIVREGKENGWFISMQNVLCSNIRRLIKDEKFFEAYNEYKKCVFIYNSRKVHDTFEVFFKDKKIYDMNFKMDLR
jgi:hypothetical protein